MADKDPGLYRKRPPTPEAMVTLITSNLTQHTLAFTEEDLPPEGVDHNKPLHITMKCLGKWVPTILFDNGSAIYVCPLRTAYSKPWWNSVC